MPFLSYEHLRFPCVADSPQRSISSLTTRSFVRSLCKTARAHCHRTPPPDRKDTPSKGGVMVWESSLRAPPPVPYQTTSRAGLPAGPVAAPRCAKVSCRRHRRPTARALPHPRSRVVVALPPFRRALPARPRPHLLHDARCRRARAGPELRAHLRPPRCVDLRKHRVVRCAPHHQSALLALLRSR